jgi:pSer/pThr/pTyr-binding forkhead associated (FHA) protein
MEQFLKATGASGPLRIEVSGPEGAVGDPFVTPGPFAILGRDGHADVVLPDGAVSRRHAYFQVIDGRVFGVDLDSRSGIRWRAGRQKTGWIDRGESVQIGPYRVKVSGPAGPDTGPTGGSGNLPVPFNPSGTPGCERPTPVLEVLDRGDRRAAWPLTIPLALVGRSPNCTLQLDDTSVSRFHIALLNSPDGVWVIDLLGRNGVRVNGAHVRAARLEQGDDLRVGEFTLVLRFESGPVAPVRLPPSGPTRSLPAPPARAMPAGLPALPRAPRAALPAAETRLVQHPLAEQVRQAVVIARLLGPVRQDDTDFTREELEHVLQLAEAIRRLPPDPSRLSGADAGNVDREAVAGAWLSILKTLAGPADPLGQSLDPSAPAPRATSDGPGNGRAEATVPGEACDPAPGPAATTDAGNLPSVDFHTVLCDRMTTLHHERRPRWRKILGAVTGR